MMKKSKVLNKLLVVDSFNQKEPFLLDVRTKKIYELDKKWHGFPFEGIFTGLSAGQAQRSGAFNRAAESSSPLIRIVIVLIVLSMTLFIVVMKRKKKEAEINERHKSRQDLKELKIGFIKKGMIENLPKASRKGFLAEGLVIVLSVYLFGIYLNNGKSIPLMTGTIFSMMACESILRHVNLLKAKKMFK